MVKGRMIAVLTVVKIRIAFKQSTFRISQDQFVTGNALPFGNN